ncbi:MAG: hypothetical protein COV36_04355 [Alphaproteobacteria bacterium CG11_big_fil_rev_8_21_14_0_20_44_7]|nr:MAG: hypothetical protein COV36_04355 [Alphaproteobacteria bacterium CG11_big_fil_rev_8_21_14_0_20_44_7]
MTPEEENKIIDTWAQHAMKSMTERKVQPLPENYSIWFEYARGSNKKLIQAVDKLVADKKDFDRSVTRDLYNTFILKEVNTRIVEEASSRVQKIMSGVLKTIETSAEGTENYGKQLDEFTNDLAAAGNEDIAKFIEKIVTKTSDLKSKGLELNKQLKQSREEVEVLKVNLEEVSSQVALDALTGIANRKAFDESIIRMMAEAKETGKDLCLLMVDVDHFKKFNDNYGHLLGDQVLRIVASVLKDVIRGKDFVSRFGGEEFALLLPETPLNGAQIVAENIRRSIASKELKRKDTGESYGKLTVSLGVSCLRHRFDKVDDFIERADKALYTSKDRGRNTVTVES